MAKKMKKPKKVKRAIKKKRRPKAYMMVIRVSVPERDVKEGMRIWTVWGLKNDRAPAHELQILNAYYDMAGQPNAMPDPQ